MRLSSAGATLSTSFISINWRSGVFSACLLTPSTLSSSLTLSSGYRAMKNTMLYVDEAASLKHFVGFGGERLVTEEESLHGGLLRGGVFKVKHIDVSTRRVVVSVKQFDLFPILRATGDLNGFF